MKKIVVLNLVALFFFLVCRFIAYYLLLNPELARGFIFLPILTWSLKFNTNLAFSLALPNFLIIILMGLVLIFLAWWWFNSLKNLVATENFYLALIIAGALSNLSDRLNWGGVLDYWQFLNLSIFNLADVLIVVGIIGLLLKNLLVNENKTYVR
ncbi:MAG: signal peptidase II [Candidatus Buchananbacteria bacterium]